MASPQQVNAFFTQVLHDLNAPVTSTNLALFAGWAGAEGTAALNNPLATTQPAAGATSFNSVGVKNYPSEAVGAQATAQTIANGNYPGIVSALRSGQGIFAVYGNSQVYGELNTWSGNAGAGTSLSSYVRNVLNIAQGNPQGQSAATPGLFGSGTLFGAAPALGQAAQHVPGVKQTESLISSVSSVGGFFGKITQPNFLYRVGEIILGSALTLMGLYLLARQVGLGAPSVSLPGGGSSGQAADALGAAFDEGVSQGERAQARAAGRRSVASVPETAEEPGRAARERRERIRAEADRIDEPIPF